MRLPAQPRAAGEEDGQEQERQGAPVGRRRAGGAVGRAGRRLGGWPVGGPVG